MAKQLESSPGSSLARPEPKPQRGRRGVSLQQIADTTKISIRFLRAIEAEEFAVLPGGIIGRSYIRQYAEAAGCDAETLLERYREQCAEPETEEIFPAPRRPPGTEHGRMAPPQWLRAFGSIKL